MDAVRSVALVAALVVVGCNSTSSTMTSTLPFGGTATATTQPARSQAPADPPAPVQQAAATAAGATRQIRVVALVGTDAVITDDEVWQMVRHRRAEFESLTAVDREQKEKVLFREELRRLVERELLIVEMMGKLRKNKPQMLDEIKEQVALDCQRRLKQIRKEMGNPSDADFVAILSIQRLTQKGLLRQFERAQLKDIYLGQYLKEKKREISLAEVRQYYDDHAAEFQAEDRVKWLDLFVAAGRFDTPEACRQAAVTLAQQARSGADFVGLVKQHGHGDSRLRDGEGIGAKRGEIRPAELESAVFTLSAGQVSDPIPTDTGYHILKALEREKAGRKPFDAATQTAIRIKLMNQFQQTEAEKLIDELWRKTTVEFVGVP